MCDSYVSRYGRTTAIGMKNHDDNREVLNSEHKIEIT